MKLTAEQFLREKLESEISSFGDGTTEFHTRDIEHLLKCLEEKDSEIHELIAKINYNAEDMLKELLTDCMTTSNWSAEERLNYIRHHYKSDYTKLCAVAEKV
jgi:hypothetical protein